MNLTSCAANSKPLAVRFIHRHPANLCSLRSARRLWNPANGSSGKLAHLPAAVADTKRKVRQRRKAVPPLDAIHNEQWLLCVLLRVLAGMEQ